MAAAVMGKMPARVATNHWFWRVVARSLPLPAAAKVRAKALLEIMVGSGIRNTAGTLRAPLCLALIQMFQAATPRSGLAEQAVASAPLSVLGAAWITQEHSG